MAGHGDLQELLRMFTARKISMMASMKHVQALQAKNLKTYRQPPPSDQRVQLTSIASTKSQKHH